MDVDLIKKALCFHGKPMQKIWDDERGAGDLQKMGVPEDGNYSIYMERQKYFTFQDRAKRLKLHQFLARKAPDLYDNDLLKMYLLRGSALTTEEREKAKFFVARVPSYEIVMPHKQDKTKILRRVLESLQPGDIIYAIVIRSKSSISSAPIVVKPLCTGEPCVHILRDSNIKALIPNQLVGSLPLDKLGKPRSISTNDYLCCEMVEFSIDADRMTLSLEHTIDKHKNAKLGIISQDELPLIYRKTVDNTLEKYEECIRKAKEFENPNCKILYIMNGLVINDTFSVMRSLKCEFPRPEYAKELRQIQASKWAFRSVAEGIEYFKIGQHVEAFQCLNRALNIDPRNVEGLVARGALYANKGSFLKAVEDFEKALKLNAYHVNARKYMGETLVALARSYEEDNRIQDAAKAYRDCLNIIPNHEQARLSLEVIQQRTGASVEPLSVPVYDSSHNISENEKLAQKQRASPPSLSSNESNATESSSASGSDSSEIPHTSTSKKDRSLSPLSKKMVLHSASLESSNKQPKFNQPFYMTQTVSSSTVIPNEFKLDEDDTETRVRKLLHEASKHKKEKKKSKKKKSKKSKKSSSKNKESSNILDKINLEEAYKFLGSGLHLESKLNENLKLYEQTIAEIKKRQELLEQAQQITNNAAAIPTDTAVKKREKSETPPPRAPSMRICTNDLNSSSTKSTTSTSSFKIMGFGKTQVPPPPPSIKPEPAKFSFQIKKPVKVDKFGLVRLATPALPKSPTLSPERRSRSRHRSRSGGRRKSRSHSQSSRERRSSRYRRQRSTTRSRSLSPYNKRRYRSSRRRISRSFSRSRSHSRPQTKSVRRRGGDYRRSPSPFVPRGTPSPRSRHRRSPSTRRSHRYRRHISRSPSHNHLPPARHTNRTWQRPGYNPLKSSSSFTSNSSSNKNSSNKSSSELWPHDKFEDKNDGPSIEEIDEIINRAQKERKEEIIKRDKNILKKSSTGNF